MSLKAKAWIAIAAVVVLAALFTLRQVGRPAPYMTQRGDTGQPANPATGNADDITSELLQESSAEADGFTAETGDSAMLASDSEVFGNVGGTYDENAF